MSSFTSDRTNRLEERIILIFPDSAWEELRKIALEINTEKTSAEVLLEMLARQVWSFYEDGSVYIVTRSITLQGEIVSLPRGDYGFQTAIVSNTSQFTVTKAFRMGLKVESDWEIVTSQRGLPFPTTRGAFQLLESILVSGEEPPTIRPTDLSWPEIPTPLVNNPEILIIPEEQSNNSIDASEHIDQIQPVILSDALLYEATTQSSQIEENDNSFVNTADLLSFDNYIQQISIDEKGSQDSQSTILTSSSDQTETHTTHEDDSDSPFINITEGIDFNSFLKNSSSAETPKPSENQPKENESDGSSHSVPVVYELNTGVQQPFERPITALEVPLPTQTEDAPQALVEAAEKSFNQIKQATTEEKEEDRQSQIDLWIELAKQQAQQNANSATDNSSKQADPIELETSQPVFESVTIENIPIQDPESIDMPNINTENITSEPSESVEMVSEPDYSSEIPIPSQNIQEVVSLEPQVISTLDPLQLEKESESVPLLEPTLNVPEKSELFLEQAHEPINIAKENELIMEPIPLEPLVVKSASLLPLPQEGSIVIDSSQSDGAAVEEDSVEAHQHMNLLAPEVEVGLISKQPEEQKKDDYTPPPAYELLFDFGDPVEPAMNVENTPETPVIKVSNQRSNDLDWWFSSEPISDVGQESQETSTQPLIKSVLNSNNNENPEDMLKPMSGDGQNLQTENAPPPLSPNMESSIFPLLSDRLESWGPDIFRRHRAWEMNNSISHGWENVAEITPLRLVWFFPDKTEAKSKWESIVSLGTVRAVLFADDAILSKEDGPISLRFRELWRERYRQSRVELESETTRLRILRSNIEQIEKSFQEYAGYQEELLRLGTKEIVNPVVPVDNTVALSPQRQELVNLLIQMQTMEEQLQKSVESSRNMVDLVKSDYLKLQENYLRVLEQVAEKERYSAQPKVSAQQQNPSAQPGNPLHERTRNNYNEQIRAIDRFLQDSYGQYFQNDPIWNYFTTKDIFGLSQTLVFRERSLSARLKTLSNWQMLMESDAYLLEPQIWIGTCNSPQMFETHNYYPHIIISNLDANGNKRIESLVGNTWMIAKLDSTSKWILSPGGITPPDDPMLLISVVVEQDENKNLAKVVWDERELTGERGAGNGV